MVHSGGSQRPAGPSSRPPSRVARREVPPGSRETWSALRPVKGPSEYTTGSELARTIATNPQKRAGIDRCTPTRLRRVPREVRPPRGPTSAGTVSYTHLRAHETRHDLVCRLLLE